MKPIKFGNDYVTPLQTMSCFAFGFGVLFLLLGSVITFVPGTAQGWFTVTAVLLLGGFFIPRWPFRVASVVLVAVCVWTVIDGYRSGIKYRQRLQLKAFIRAVPSP